MTTYIYKVEEIFKEIPDDNTQLKMTIPDEILTIMGWTTGDRLTITMDDTGLIIHKDE